MQPDEFIPAYEQALATQDWTRVQPLMHPDVCVTFSSGSVHIGREAVAAAFSRNFSLIQGEHYAISNVRWIRRSHDLAAYLFEFTWSGLINGEPANGGGTGTAVLIRDHDAGPWQLLIEHLGPAPR